MGKGKGVVNKWVCKVKFGKMLYEVFGKNLILIK